MEQSPRATPWPGLGTVHSASLILSCAPPNGWNLGHETANCGLISATDTPQGVCGLVGVHTLCARHRSRTLPRFNSIWSTNTAWSSPVPRSASVRWTHAIPSIRTTKYTRDPSRVESAKSQRSPVWNGCRKRQLATSRPAQLIHPRIWSQHRLLNAQKRTLILYARPFCHSTTSKATHAPADTACPFNHRHHSDTVKEMQLLKRA